MSQFLNGRVSVLVGDITRQTVDAIVNAANSALRGGGGVDGAIHRAGGAAILAECRELRRTRYPDGLPTGEAVITTAGLLPARFCIHTVGPVFGQHGGREAELLAACYQNSLRLAAEHHLSSLAFPAISTGVYGYPREAAARVASRAITNFLTGAQSKNDSDSATTVKSEGDARRAIQEVRLVFFSEPDAAAFLRHHDFPTAHPVLS